MKSRIMIWATHVARMGKRRVAYKVLVRKSDGKRTFGRLRCTWEDNIKMDLQEVGGGAWIGFIYLRRGTGGELL